MASTQRPDVGHYARLRVSGQLQSLMLPQWLDVREGRVEIKTKTSLPQESVSLLRLTWE